MSAAAAAPMGAHESPWGDSQLDRALKNSVTESNFWGSVHLLCGHYVYHLPAGFKMTLPTAYQWAAEAPHLLEVSLPPGTDPAAHVNANCHKYLTSFADFAPLLKHRAFKDEYEWRLVGIIPSNDSRVQLRQGRSMLIPYVPIKLGLPTNGSLVWNIRIGPTPNMSLASNAASHLFARATIKNGIEPSMVPYRDW